MSLTYQRLRKQEMLLDAILYDKLNREELLNYLIKLKGDNYNMIDVWSIQELESAIKEFRKDKLDIVQIEQDQGEEIIVQSNAKINDEFNYKEALKCKQIPNNQLVGYLKQNPTMILQPKIVEYQIIDEGFFAPNYVNYKVVVEGLDSAVWRRVEQFYWLSEMLALQYPDSLIPPLPQKTIIRKYTPEHLSKRCKMLEQYLSALLSNHLLRQSDLVEAFLIQDDELKFKQVIIASSVIKGPSKCSDFQNLEGHVIAEFNPLMNQYFIDMNTYLTQTNDVYKNLTDNSHFAMDSLNDFIQKIKNLNLNVGQIRDITKQFNQKNMIGSIPLLEDVYAILNDYLNDWSENLQRLSKTLTENLYEFFRFQRDMQTKCCELITNRNKAQIRFQKENQDLMKKKLKYFTSEPIEKWELVPNDYDRIKLQQNRDIAFPLMFPKETMEVNELKVKYGYVNKQSYEQISQYFDHKSILYLTRLSDMMERKQGHSLEHQQQIELIARKLQQMQQMRNGERNAPDLPQEWVEEYYSPYSILSILNINIT